MYCVENTLLDRMNADITTNSEDDRNIALSRSESPRPADPRQTRSRAAIMTTAMNAVHGPLSASHIGLDTSVVP